MKRRTLLWYRNSNKIQKAFFLFTSAKKKGEGVGTSLFESAPVFYSCFSIIILQKRDMGWGGGCRGGVGCVGVGWGGVCRGGVTWGGE